MTRRFVLLTLLLAGCGFFSKTKSTFYALETIPPQGAPAAVSGTPIGIEGIELPPGIDRREIAVRTNDYRLELRGTQQWSAPLEDMVIHTLAFDLAKRLPEGMVVLPGQAKPAAVRSIYVIFEDLAAGQDRVFVLDARWTLSDSGRAQKTGHERVTVNAQSMDSAKIASAMSEALAALADRIVAGL